MNALEEIISREIAECKILPFNRFMEIALYQPDYGYYEKTHNPIGRQGDFITSVSVGEVYGKLIAELFCRWSGDMELPFVIIEGGAHDGQFALDVLQSIIENCEDCRDRFQYWLIEPSSLRKKKQQGKLENLPIPTRWFSRLEEIPDRSLNGVVFCNELLDAFPVRRLGWDKVNENWFEWGVGSVGDEFTWQRLEQEPVKLPDHVKSFVSPELLEVLPDGFIYEWSPQAEAWWQKACRILKSGKMVCVDYGLETMDFFSPHRLQGTLRAYRNQKQEPHLLKDPGTKDLTFHIDFGRLREIGEAESFSPEFYGLQADFLIKEVLAKSGDLLSVEKWSVSQRRQLQTLTHPEMFGSSFRVLVQSIRG